MSILNFKPTIWSPILQVALRQNTIYDVFTNRDYEGSIVNAGDAVRITSVNRPTIKTYVPNVTVVTPEVATDSSRTLVVDQSDYFDVAVDDVDARQAQGNVISQLINEGAFAEAVKVDLFLSSFYTAIQTANQIGPISVSLATPAQLFDNVIVPLKIRLDKANVPPQGRSLALSPDLQGFLLRDPRFVTVNQSGTDTALRQGVVSQAIGFDILLSNQAPSTNGGGDAVVIAGNNTAITFAEQIAELVPYRPQTSFSDAIKALFLYGAKVVRPDSLASANVTVTA